MTIVDAGESSGGIPGADGGAAADPVAAPKPDAGVPDKYASVRVHDFRLPKTLDRNDIRSLQVLYEPLAHRASGLLTNRLRTPITLTLGEFQQHPWGDYANALPEPTCLFTVTLPPLPGRVVLHVPLSLAMVIVELRMGGTGKRKCTNERALTEIEQQLMTDVASAILAEIPAVLAPVMTLATGVPIQVSSAQFLPPIRPADMSMLVPVIFEVHEETQFTFDLCFPFSIVQPLIETLAAQVRAEETPRAEEEAAIAQRVLETQVDLRVLFPSTTLTPADFLNLEVGDVVGLPYDQGDALALMVGDQHHLDVLPTTSGKRLACVVVDHTEKQP